MNSHNKNKLLIPLHKLYAGTLYLDIESIGQYHDYVICKYFQINFNALEENFHN